MSISTLNQLHLIANYPELVGYSKQQPLFKDAVIATSPMDFFSKIKTDPDQAFIVQTSPKCFYFRKKGDTTIMRIAPHGTSDDIDEFIILNSRTPNSTVNPVVITASHQSLPPAVVMLEYARAGKPQMKPNHDAITTNMKNAVATMAWAKVQNLPIDRIAPVWNARSALVSRDVASLKVKDGEPISILSIEMIKFIIEGVTAGLLFDDEPHPFNLFTMDEVIADVSLLAASSSTTGIIVDNREAPDQPSSATHFWIALQTSNGNFIINSKTDTPEGWVQKNIQKFVGDDGITVCKVPQQTRSDCGMMSISFMVAVMKEERRGTTLDDLGIQEICAEVRQANVIKMYATVHELAGRFSAPISVRKKKDIEPIAHVQLEVDSMRDLKAKLATAKDEIELKEAAWKSELASHKRQLGEKSKDLKEIRERKVDMTSIIPISVQKFQESITLGSLLGCSIPQEPHLKHQLESFNVENATQFQVLLKHKIPNAVLTPQLKGKSISASLDALLDKKTRIFLVESVVMACCKSFIRWKSTKKKKGNPNSDLFATITIKGEPTLVTNLEGCKFIVRELSGSKKYYEQRENVRMVVNGLSNAFIALSVIEHCHPAIQHLQHAHEALVRENARLNRQTLSIECAADKAIIATLKKQNAAKNNALVETELSAARKAENIARTAEVRHSHNVNKPVKYQARKSEYNTITLKDTNFKPAADPEWSSNAEYKLVLDHFISEPQPKVTSLNILQALTTSGDHKKLQGKKNTDWGIFVNCVGRQIGKWYSDERKTVFTKKVPLQSDSKFENFMASFSVLIQVLSMFKKQFAQLVKACAQITQAKKDTTASSPAKETHVFKTSSKKRQETMNEWDSLAEGAIVLAKVKNFKLDGVLHKRFGTSSLIRTKGAQGKWTFSILTLEESAGAYSCDGVCESRMREISKDFVVEGIDDFTILTNNNGALNKLERSRNPMQGTAKLISGDLAFMQDAKKALSKKISSVHRAEKKTAKSTPKAVSISPKKKMRLATKAIQPAHKRQKKARKLATKAIQPAHKRNKKARKLKNKKRKLATKAVMPSNKKQHTTESIGRFFTSIAS